MASPSRAPIKRFDHDPEALVWARKKDGRTQGDLAVAAGISQGHLCEIEKGTRNAPPYLITKFAQILNCPRSVLEAKTCESPSENGGAS